MASNKTADEKHSGILVVDDEANIRTIVKPGLEMEGFEVDTNDDPRSVLAKYEPGQYDLLILDIRMPGMTGFQLFREIRKVDRV